MRDHPRSIFHFVLLFVFIFSQITPQPVLAAATNQPDGKNVRSQFTKAMPGPEPARMGPSIVPVEKFKSTKTALEIAARLKLLGYTLPTYPIQSSTNGLSIEPLVAYNLIVDSNVLSPSSYGPSAATFGAKFCNTSTTDTLTNVSAYIGNYDGDYDANLGEATPGDITPGYFPRRTSTAPAYDPVAFATAYGSGTTNPLVGSTLTDYGATNAPFALQLASGTTPPQVDATRYIGTLAPGDCKTEYWVVTYPRKACSSGTVCDVNNATRKDVTGGVKPDDDLWLPYWFWGTSTLGGSTQTSYRWNVVTMRNEISAMANKIWPNGDNKVPDEYIQAIRDLLGWDTWTPNGTSTVYPGDTVISKGIWYDLGNVGAGFDNNGDFVPDRNAWVQPIGDASGYDPGCFRMVHNYGLVIVKLNDGTEQLIPFEDQLYFENIPDNNNGAVGLVYYEYAALNGVCTANLTPYQEVASGYDNEKFNADYGAGVPPLQSQQSNMTLDKTGPSSIGLGGTINYSLTFTLPDIDGGTADTITVGQPSLGAPLTYSDTVPVGLQYVACSAFSIPPPGSCANATVTVDMSSNYPYGDAVTHDINAELWHSKDGGATWISGDPGTYTGSSTSNQLVLQWRLQSGVTSPASGPAYTGTVAFQAVVPGAYTPVQIVNQACMKIGQGPGFVCDPHTTLVTGNSAITGVAWKDDGVTGGVSGNGIQDGTEAGIGDTNSNGSGVTVKLYWDANGDGDYADSGDFLYGTTTTNASGAYCFGGTLSGTTCTASSAAGLPAANTAGAGNPRYIIVVDPADDDIPTGYGPTTTTSYTKVALPATSVYGDALDASEPSDFGFTPALAVQKWLSSASPVTEGQQVQFTLQVSNTLPGNGTGGSTCSYTMWAKNAYLDNATGNNPPGAGQVNGQWSNINSALGAPDERFAGTNLANTTNILGLGNFGLGNMGGDIQSVQFYANLHERVEMSAGDSFSVKIWYDTNNDGTSEDRSITYQYYGNGTVSGSATQTGVFNQTQGIEYRVYEPLNLTSVTGRTSGTWLWSDFTTGKLEAQAIADKQGGGGANLDLDSFGFIITTNGTCGGPSTILNPVPLLDRYDSRYLQFVASIPPITSGPTVDPDDPNYYDINWSNVGPLYPGQSRNIVVNFLSKSVGASTQTYNMDESDGAKFVSGVSANSDLWDAPNNNTNNNWAPVTITPRGSISGRIWNDSTNTGWQAGSTTGFDTGEVGIAGVTLTLYGCTTTSTSGVLVTTGSASNNNSCAQQNGNKGAWTVLRTAITDGSGNYSFSDLDEGFYYVAATTLPTGAVQRGEKDTAAGDQDGTPQVSGGNSIWGDPNSNLQTAANTFVNFDYLSAGEDITNVNFGYNGFTPALYGYIWQDYDGDGVRDADDLALDNGATGVTVTVLDCGTNSTCGDAGDTTLGTYNTNTDGMYMVPGLTAGHSYRMTVNTGTLPAGTWTNTEEDAPSGSSDVAAQGATGNSVLISKNVVAGELIGGFNFGYYASGTYSIGDTLFYDWDGDASQDIGVDEGIPNINVRLHHDWNNDGVMDPTDPIRGITTTFAYQTIGGCLDIDRDGLTAGDDGDDLTGLIDSDGTTRRNVINGYLDINGDAVINTNDDGVFFGLAIVDGYFDIDGDGTAAGDSGDALGIGQYRFNGLVGDDYIVRVVVSDTDFPADVYETKDPGESGVCVVCDSLNKVTISTASNMDQDFGYRPRSSGTLGDTVFRDINGNGIQDGTAETGISGVTVELTVDRDGNGTYVTVATATTDSSGKYLFTGLPVGAYRVSINLSSNTAAIPNDPFGKDYFPSNGTNTGTIVYMNKTLTTIAPNNLTADFAFAPPAAIGDTVYQDINRNGTQDLNEPGINGVTVTLYTFIEAGNRNGVYNAGEGFTDLNNNSTWDSGEPFVDVPNGRYDPGESLTSTGQTATTTTIGGKQGIYQFTGLQPGYYTVQVTPPAGSVLTADPNTDGIPCVGLTPGGEPSSKLCDSRDGMRLYNGTLYMGADFGYAWSGTFGDRVWIDSNDNGRVDVGERGIPNITVTARTTVPTGATVVVNGTTYTQGQVINLSTATDADGVYFFQNISTNATITWTVAVDRTDTDFPAGMTNSTDPNDPDRDDNPVHDDATIVTMDSSGVVTAVGALLDADDDGDASDPLYLDVDFGYRYEGDTTISGTVCLETTVDGVCGDNTADPNGVGTGETAYRNVTVFLYLLNDTNSNGRFDTGETTSMVSSTLTTSSGDFSFSNVKGGGVYYIVAIGAPQNGLDMTSTQATVNSGGDDSSTTNYVETTSVDGSTLSAYQVVHTTAGDTSVVDRDFAFRLDGSYDFGDLPETYSTTLSGMPDGPRHLIPTTPALYFGTAGATQMSLVDTDGMPTSDASGDGADENGVFIYTDAVHGAENADGWTDGVGVMQFDIVGSGWLVGWMDFNNDGDFTDSNEMILNRAVTSGQDQDFPITTPTTAITSPYVYARFRLFASQPAVPSLAFSGEASTGEVEDYRFPTGGGVVTPVTLAYFQAQRRGSRVDFTWSTAAESGNIGFNLFVETQDGGSLQINDELILSKGIDLLTRQDYIYSINVGGDTFYLQEVSVLGEARLHGPFRLGETYGSLPTQEKVDLIAVQNEHRQKLTVRQTSASKSMSVPAAAKQATTFAPFTVANVQLQNTVTLKVNRTGIHRVTYEMLKAAGLDIAGVPVTKITLLKSGRVVPIYLVSQGMGKARGKFGPGDYFEFYGEALDTLYTDTNIYTVQVSRSAAPHLASNLAMPVRSAKAPTSFIDTLVINNQRAYANYAPGADPWYDTSMVATTRKSWSFSFQLNELVDTSAPQSLELGLWGSTDWPETDPDHHIIVRVNGVSVAEDIFEGMVEHTLRVSLPAGTLRQGANTLELTLPADTGASFDAITLDRFSVGYSRSFRAQNGRLTFTAVGKIFTVTDLPSKNIVVYRLDGSKITRLEGIKVQQAGSTFSASFAGSGKVSTYLVAAAEALYAPTLEAARPIGNLDQPAQYLIIAHPDFISGLQPLIQARQAQGFTVSVVDVNDIYAKYSYGIFDPQAIKQYIVYARNALGTQYILLVGGDTYDYRNFLGKNSLSFIPSLYMATGPTSKFVPVDPLYADVDNNQIPDLAIGRFPVRTSAELNLMIAKTLAYARKDYEHTAVFASDKFDGVESFKNISQNISSSLPAGWSVQQINMDDMSVSIAQKQLIAALNKGVALVNYTGHSAPTVWSFSRLFQPQNAEALTNVGRPFVVVQWGCFNTYYVDPLNKTLVQSFLFSGDRGAVAIMGASTRTDSSSEEALGVLITPRLVAPGMTIGQAMQDAKFELAQEHPELLDVILGWTLMGDPALVIQP